MKTRARIVLTLALVLLGGRARAQFCPGCIQNSPTPQNATFNLTQGATIQGVLTVGALDAAALNVVSLTVSSVTGSGHFLTNLNASQLLSGVVPAAALVGAYTGITQVGTLTAGTYEADPVGTQYGGTGQNFVSVSAGSLLYFSGTGQMGTFLPGAPQQLLQTNGAGAPVWVSSPAVSAVNLYNVPASRLVGNLPPFIAVSSNSIAHVNGAGVLGDISGNAQNINGTLLQSQIAPGTWSSAYAASSITATGVTPIVCGGPSSFCQVNIHSDGRVYAASQSSLAVPAASIQPGALPGGVTIGAAQVTAGNLANNVVASNIAPNGVVAGTYGSGSTYAIVVVDASGRVTDAASHSFSGITPATNTVTTTIFGYVPSTQMDPAVVTLQGNNFNGPSQLVRNLSGGALPALNAVNLTNLTGANVVGPVATSTALAVTPTAAPSGFVSRGIDASGNSLNATVDAVAVNGSTNPIQSGAVFGMSGFNGGVVQHFTLFQSSVEVNGAVVGHSSGTFSSLFADGSHLTGIPQGPCVSTGTLQGVVCAGQSNTAISVHQAVFIAGGGFNAVNQDYGFAAGYNNTVGGGGSISASVGGEFNTNSGVNGFTGGGNTNTLNSGSQSAIVGGGSHLLDGNSSFMGGGLTNIVNGDFAAIVGGQLDVATGTYAMAAGYKAHANENGTYVWADSGGTVYNSHGANTWNARPAGGFWLDGDIKSINSVPYSFPSSQGGASTALTNDGAGNLSWAAAGGSPGGATTQVQFNDSGAFNGDDAMRWDNTAKSLRLTTTANDPGYAGTVVGYAATDTPLYAGTDGVNDNLRLSVTATPVSGVRMSGSRIILTAAGNNGIIIQTNGFVGFGNNPNPNYVVDAIGDINASNYLRLSGVASISRSGSQVVFGTGNASIDDTGLFSVGATPVQWYYCTGSTAGTFDGNLARGNANAGACAGGTWVATSITAQ